MRKQLSLCILKAVTVSGIGLNVWVTGNMLNFKMYDTERRLKDYPDLEK